MSVEILTSKALMIPQKMEKHEQAVMNGGASVPVKYSDPASAVMLSLTMNLFV